MKVTSFSRLYTLMLLSSSPRHGYEIIKELEENIHKKISAAEVYPFLRDLKKLQYIAVESTGNRDMKRYILTPKGRKFTQQILDNLSKMIDVLTYSKVVSCAHCCCKVYGDAYTLKIKEKEVPFCCKYCAQAYKVDK